MLGMRSIAPRRVALDPALHHARVGYSGDPVPFWIMFGGPVAGFFLAAFGHPFWGATLFFGAPFLAQLWVRLTRSASTTI